MVEGFRYLGVHFCSTDDLVSGTGTLQAAPDTTRMALGSHLPGMAGSSCFGRFTVAQFYSKNPIYCFCKPFDKSVLALTSKHSVVCTCMLTDFSLFAYRVAKVALFQEM